MKPALGMFVEMGGATSGVVAGAARVAGCAALSPLGRAPPVGRVAAELRAKRAGRCCHEWNGRSTGPLGKTPRHGGPFSEIQLWHRDGFYRGAALADPKKL